MNIKKLVEKRMLGSGFASKDGFSLIEVIVAATVLGLLAVPILMYFTNSAVRTSDARYTQAANVAAQSVVESIDTCGDYKQIEEELLKSDSSWKVVNKATNTGADTVTNMGKTITSDGKTFDAKITIDYSGKAAGYNSPVSGTAKYNTYEKPDISKVYSSNNVVLADSTKLAVNAANEFYYKNKSSASLDDIKDDMDRELFVTLDKQPGGDVYWVKSYYEYVYNGQSNKQTVKDTKIIIDDLERIYIFYSDPKLTKVKFDYVDDMTDKKIYLVYQGNSASANALTLEAGSNFLTPKYYTNGITLNNCSDYSKKLYDTTVDNKRIANITVDIYDTTDATRKLVSLNTTKGA